MAAERLLRLCHSGCALSVDYITAAGISRLVAAGYYVASTSGGSLWGKMNHCPLSLGETVRQDRCKSREVGLRRGAGYLCDTGDREVFGFNLTHRVWN